MKKSIEGQMRVVEVLLASFVIVFALSFANILTVVPTSPKYEVTELEKLGYNVLYDLDKQNLLARFVYNEEWQNLASAIRVNLPLDVYFNATVYDLQGTQMNTAPVFYGNLATFQSSKNVVSVTYGLVGYPVNLNTTHYHVTYNVRLLTLQLLRG
jgi:hypothetical protein